MADYNKKDDLSKAEEALNIFNKYVSPVTSGSQNFGEEGFTVPPTAAADGNGLPYSKIIDNREGILRRNIITWFVPEFGTVKMYINPSQISYNFKKAIQKERTKGGYVIHYWGEELTTLNISGTTGSSGIEGINALYEVYRAEQYAFDSQALVLAASNSASQDLASRGISALGSAINSKGGAGDAVGFGIGTAILGLDPSISGLSASGSTSLAKLACSVEMYYNGWVYRGFFENMTVTEKASDFCLDYNITFTATQRRGYRTNYFPWSRSPNYGPSRTDTPYSYNSNTTVNTYDIIGRELGTSAPKSSNNGE